MGTAMTLDNPGDFRVNPDWQSLLTANGIASADALWQLTGTPVKQAVKERGTSRCVLHQADGTLVETYLKRYYPIPWREKLKNILCRKPYAFDAFHEWDALTAFHELQLPTLTPLAAARLSDGRSCDLTLGITGYTRASELFLLLDRQDPRRLKLVRRLAAIVGRMHAAGIAHQDLYLVHFFILEELDDLPYLIDLQRTIWQTTLVRRWRVKDLAELFFSAFPVMTETEISTLWNTYAETAGIDPDDTDLRLAVRRKMDRIIAHDRKRQQKKSNSD